MVASLARHIRADATVPFRFLSANAFICRRVNKYASVFRPYVDNYVSDFQKKPERDMLVNGLGHLEEQKAAVLAATWIPEKVIRSG